MICESTNDKNAGVYGDCHPIVLILPFCIGIIMVITLFFLKRRIIEQQETMATYDNIESMELQNVAPRDTLPTYEECTTL